MTRSPPRPTDGGLAGLLFARLRELPRPLSHEQARRLAQRLFRDLPCQVDGLEHIPRQGPALVLTNHTGFEEILLMALLLPRPFHVLSFYELLFLDERVSWERIFATEHARHYSPLLREGARWLGRLGGGGLRAQLRAFGVIPTHVYNDGSDPMPGHNGVRDVLRALSAGALLLIYPEGDIRKDGVMAPFRPGLSLVLRLMLKRGLTVPVVPGAQRSRGALRRWPPLAALAERIPLLGEAPAAPAQIAFAPARWFDEEGRGHLLAPGEAAPRRTPSETARLPEGAAARQQDRQVVLALQDEVAALLRRIDPTGPPQRYAAGTR